ncbi:hypothetical protein [Paracoccus sp. IB05]|uniref:hypothetical protein n=1 Tax=Paracoccus sp. IB05 TaxID=2779367 RepID=UPI0018E8028A|nr:hypothetical protein [Paracoccus sp. IB05]MBJ2151473.1 hypothetical protein [Paracoccus sp. IB05]
MAGFKRASIQKQLRTSTLRPSSAAEMISASAPAFVVTRKAPQAGDPIVSKSPLELLASVVRSLIRMMEQRIGLPTTRFWRSGPDIRGCGIGHRHDPEPTAIRQPIRPAPWAAVPRSRRNWTGTGRSSACNRPQRNLAALWAAFSCLTPYLIFWQVGIHASEVGISVSAARRFACRMIAVAQML